MSKTLVHINCYLREILLTILEPLLTSASVSLNCERVWRREWKGGRKGSGQDLGYNGHTSIYWWMYVCKV